jgi:predicted NAD/FAD-binding protein
MLFEIIKFNSIATKQDINVNINLDEFLDIYNFSQYFRRNYIYAMAGSIWSCDIEQSKFYPAKSFIDFFKNHGLLRVINHPQWYCVKGGSKNYVQKVLQDIEKHSAKIIKSNVLKVFKDGDKLRVLHQKIDTQKSENTTLSEDIFDKVIVATHADEAYQITSNDALLGFKYSKNLAVLHKDESLMPKNKKTWASWNYVSNSQNSLSLTYWMNNLQNIDNSYPLFVTLNPAKQIKQSDIFYQTTYSHPIFDFKSSDIVKKLKTIQGNDGIYYAGSYLGYGFHEDGLRSGETVAEAILERSKQSIGFGTSAAEVHVAN